MKTTKELISEAVNKYFNDDTSTYIKKKKKDPYTSMGAAIQPESLEVDDIMAGEISSIGEEGEAITTTTANVATPELPLPMKILKRKYDDKLRDGTYVYNTNEEEFSNYKGMHSKGKKWNEFIDENSELGQGVKYYSKFGNVAFRNPISKGLVYIHKR